MQNVNLSVLFLANQMLPWIIMAAAIIVTFVVALLFCLKHKQNTEKTIADANEQARRIVDNAEHEADRLRAQGKEDSKRALKEALLEAKEQDLKLRNEFERETKEKKAEIQRMEQRLTQKEDMALIRILCSGGRMSHKQKMRALSQRFLLTYLNDCQNARQRLKRIE